MSRTRLRRLTLAGALAAAAIGLGGCYAYPVGYAGYDTYGYDSYGYSNYGYNNYAYVPPGGYYGYARPYARSTYVYPRYYGAPRYGYAYPRPYAYPGYGYGYPRYGYYGYGERGSQR